MGFMDKIKKKKDDEEDLSAIDIALAGNGADFSMPNMGGDDELNLDIFSTGSSSGNPNASDEEALLAQYLSGNETEAAPVSPTPAQPGEDSVPFMDAPAMETPGIESESDASSGELGDLGLGDGDDFGDDLMSIFDTEDEVDEELTTLTAGLEELDAVNILSDARQVSSRLREMIQ